VPPVIERSEGVRVRALARALAALLFLTCSPRVDADIQMPVPDLEWPIAITGEGEASWQQGAVEVWVVKGCVVEQGEMTARSDEAVLWIDRAAPGSEQPSRVTLYLEGAVAIDFRHDGPAHPVTGRPAQSIRDHRWFGRMSTRSSITLRVKTDRDDRNVRPAVYERGRQAWEAATSGVELAQFTAEPLAQPPLAPMMAATKRIQVGSRSNTLIHIKSFPGTMPNQSVTVFTNGIRAVIEGVEAPHFGHLGRIVVETDRLVLWAPNLKTLSASGSEAEGGADVPIEVYMEGHIVFRQGDRLIYADRMYYNATREYGVVLAAEMYTPVPQYQGMVRLKADVLQQLDRQFFKAYGAAVTTSQMGVPRYWFQSGEVELRDTQRPVVDPVSGQLLADYRTGEAAVEHDLFATSWNNVIYAGGLPVFYWPVMATNLTKPSYYLERFSAKNDDIFGFQAMAEWDLFQLLRVEDPPEGTSWTLSTDYLSERGMGLGTTFEYEQSSFLGHTGPVTGWFDAWGLNDQGLDNLGKDRQAVTFDNELRGRVYWRHRHDLPYFCQFTAQVGLISDRNFLEQYFEREWDEWKDQVTSLELKRVRAEQSLRILGAVRVNDFFTQTDWFPRVDHFLVGRSILGDRFTWHAHSQVGYGRQQIATAPSDPGEAANWALLPWEVPTEGVRTTTRHELDLPIQVGPIKVVPYGIGEVGYWQQLIDGEEDVTRAYGQAGVRMDLPVWRTMPTVQSMLWNLSGLAHKVNFLADLYWADASENLDRFPLYDPLDDDAQEHFRNRFGAIPPEYDERYAAFRTGIQGWVTSPTAEIVEDAFAARLGILQRWQTKRGLPGQQRVVDWITLDLAGTVFADADRDNFGEVPGQLEYDFRWHVGDRLTLMSDGFSDIFPGGLRAFSFGGAISRPERGQLYAGIVSMEGPFSSLVLVSSISYRMSPKWIADVSATYDFGETGQIGERFAITRIGESVLVRLGAYADHSRDNFGLAVSIEPRFLPKGRLGRVAGAQIAPVGIQEW